MANRILLLNKILESFRTLACLTVTTATAVGVTTSRGR